MRKYQTRSCATPAETARVGRFEEYIIKINENDPNIAEMNKAKVPKNTSDFAPSGIEREIRPSTRVSNSPLTERTPIAMSFSRPIFPVNFHS